jgi:hypothetical protein
MDWDDVKDVIGFAKQIPSFLIKGFISTISDVIKHIRQQINQFLCDSTKFYMVRDYYETQKNIFSNLLSFVRKGVKRDDIHRFRDDIETLRIVGPMLDDVEVNKIEQVLKNIENSPYLGEKKN